MAILITIFSLLFAYLTYRRLDWAVMILIVALPSYLMRFKILGIPSTLLELMILIVFAAWFLKNYKTVFLNLKSKILNLKSKIIYDYPFKWEIIFLLIISFIAAGISGFSNNALGIWKAYFFEPMLLYLVVVNTFIKNNKIEKILWAFLISALGVSVLAIYQKITGDLITNPMWADEITRRVVSFFGYPNAVGLYLGPLVLIFTGWLLDVIARSPALAGRRGNLATIKIFVVFLAVLFSLLAIYFARSKGALIGVGFALIIFGLLAGKKLRWTTLILTAIFGITIFSYQPARVYAYKKITLNDLSGQIRKAQWAETWRMLKDKRLITGAGLANYQNAITPYHQEGIFVKNDDPDFQRKVVFNAEYRKKVWQPLEIYLCPHNIFLNFWTELGFSGMLLFIWIIIKFFYLGSRLIKNYNLEIKNYGLCQSKYFVLGLMGAMTVIIIHGLVDVPYFKNDLSVMFWIFAALMGIAYLKYNISNPPVGEKEI